MKKALVVFLILAVAGGLFAEFTISGSVSSGFGIGLDDNDMDPVIGLIRSRGDNGLRGDLNLTAKVADENYGTFEGTMGFRGQIGQFGADGTYAVSALNGRLTWTLSSLPLILAIGDGGPGGTGTMGGYDTNLDAGGGNGLALQLKPVTGLTIAASAIFGKAQTTVDKVVYAGGAKFSAAGLLDVAANVTYNQAQADEKKKLDLAAGVSILPLVSSLGFNALAFDARTNNGIGAADSNIGVGERIGFKVGDLSLLLTARQLLFTGTGDVPGYIPMRFQLDVSNPIGNITPAVQVRYGRGYAPALTNFREAGELGDVAFGGEKKAALGISPQLTFNMGGPSLALGYNLQMDISDPKPPEGRTMTHLIYATINIGF